MYYNLTITSTDLGPCDGERATSVHTTLDSVADHLRGFMGDGYDITADPEVHPEHEWDHAFGGFAWDTARAELFGGLFGRDEFGDLEYLVHVERMCP